MTWAEASPVLKRSDSGTTWLHLAPVSNGLDTFVALLHHKGHAPASFMPPHFVSAALTHTHIPQTQHMGKQKQVRSPGENGVKG